MKKQQRLVLWVSILASTIAFLDGSIVNVALPAIEKELGGGLALQQWTVNAYLVTLGALILIAGSLSDLFGRKKVLQIGLIGFGLASMACALAPSGELLVVARALQGAAGALLVPSSLALITSAFSGPAQSKAIGSWTAWTGIAFIIGPLLGGFLVDMGSWRWIFGINVLPIIVTLWLSGRVGVTHDQKAGVKVDVTGAVLCALGLGGPVFALIEQPLRGWADPVVWVPLLLGAALLGTFVWYEKHAKHPMLPLELFRIRNFGAGNVATLFIYAALSAVTFLAAVFLQQVGGYGAFMTGLALMPVTIVMFFLSPIFGGLAGKYGPRWFMAGGPLVITFAYLLMLRFDAQPDLWFEVLPPILLFGVGLSITVAPLTAAVLGSIDSKHAGIASAVNNAVARVAGLLAVAAVGALLAMQFGGHIQRELAQRNVSLPAAVNEELQGRSLQVQPPQSTPGALRPVLTDVQTEASVAAFRTAITAMAALTILGGIASAVGIRNQPKAAASPRSRP